MGASKLAAVLVTMKNARIARVIPRERDILLLAMVPKVKMPMDAGMASIKWEKKYQRVAKMYALEICPTKLMMVKADPPTAIATPTLPAFDLMEIKYKQPITEKA